MNNTQAPKLAVSIPEAAEMLSIGKSLLFELIASEQFGPAILRIGRRSLVRVNELQAWLDAGMPTRDRWNWPPKQGAKWL